jgi:hypothetical protein
MTATQAPSTSGKYLSPQYAATDFSFPHAQVVRGEEDMTHCGYFIPLPQAQKAGWSNLEATETIIYTYNNGEKAEGILLTQPRMVLCAVSKLGMFDRLASQNEDRLVVIGEWNREQSKDPNNGNFQIYLVMFLGANNFPLHQIPLKIITKGAHQATLSKNWEQNCIKIAMLHAQSEKVGFFPRGEQYNTLCVFEPMIKRELVGNGKLKSAACYVDGFVQPTAANWQSFFLGESETLLAETILQILNPQPRALLSSPSSGSVIALMPPAELEVTPAEPRQISAVEDVDPTPVVTVPTVPVPVSTPARTTRTTTTRTASVPATVLIKTELVDDELEESDFIDEEDADRIPF